MDAKHTRSLREVAVAVSEHTLDVFPLDACQWLRRWSGIAARNRSVKRCNDLIGIHRLGEVARGAEFYRVDRRRAIRLRRALATLSVHHHEEDEVWIRIYKVGSGLKLIRPKEAIDVCLCWGRIDAVRKRFDG